MGKHTEEFTKQYWKSLEKEPTFAEAENFVLGLSRERTDKVISQIIAKTKRTYTTNVEIYKYCKRYGIEQDHDPYDNYNQAELDFSKPKEIDYKSMKAMEEVEIKGRKGFVVDNDKVAKLVIIEYYDTEEMETIEYK